MKKLYYYVYYNNGCQKYEYCFYYSEEDHIAGNEPLFRLRFPGEITEPDLYIEIHLQRAIIVRELEQIY